MAGYAESTEQVMDMTKFTFVCVARQRGAIGAFGTEFLYRDAESQEDAEASIRNIWEIHHIKYVLDDSMENKA